MSGNEPFRRPLVCTGKKIKASAKLHYDQEHAGHDHESTFDDSVYDNPQWKMQIKAYLVKQKAYQEMLNEVVGEDFFKVPEPEVKEEKKAEKKATKSADKSTKKSTKSDSKKSKAKK